MIKLPKAGEIVEYDVMTFPTFDWNDLSNKNGSEVGVIAQEIEALNLPGITSVREDGTLAVRYEKLVPVLIEAVKELSSKVTALENKINN